jgi:hypothetical protein
MRISLNDSLSGKISGIVDSNKLIVAQFSDDGLHAAVDAVGTVAELQVNDDTCRGSGRTKLRMVEFQFQMTGLGLI